MNLGTTEGHTKMATQASPEPMPFGYSIQSVQDIPYDPPPAPPPGPALLNEGESHMLDHFFTSMGSNHLDANDMLFGGPHPDRGSADLNFSWVEDLPPIFEGSATSLPQVSTVTPELQNGGENMLGSGPDNGGTSPEVIAAASMLYQNGQSNGSDIGTMFPTQNFAGDHFGDLYSNRPLSGSHPKPPQVSDGLGGRGLSMARKSSSYHENGNLFHDMYFGSSQPSAFDQRLPTKAADIRWGSDTSFVNQGYMAPPNQETEEEVTKGLLHQMECLEPQSSATNTRPPSPTMTRQDQTRKAWNGRSKMTDVVEEVKNEEMTDFEDDSRPRKRQKGNIKEVDDDSGEFGTTQAKQRRGKSAGRHKRLSSTTEISSRRGKSATALPKQTRENLSEEQKRSNHILSEQKRRNLIKQGFDDLCELVPELKGGGFSKSAMLIQAADWLEDMINGNSTLKAQLAELKSRSGSGGFR